VRAPDRAPADLRSAYPVAYRMATIASRLIERELDLKMTDDELGFIASYFQVFLEERRTSSTPAYRVAVVTPVGRVSARLVQLQLAKIMAESTQYTLLSLDEAFPETLDTFDLVVTTTIEPLTTTSAVIRLAEVFDRDELLGHINRLRFDRQANIPLGAGSRSLLASLLDRERFITLDPGLEYRRNLDVMIDRLIFLGLVDEEFRARLVEREQRATMALDPQIAFPHATLSGGSTRVILAVGVIPRAAGAEGLRMIVLMGVPEKADYDDTILVDVYDEIIRLAADRNGLNRISRLTSYEQFFLYMANNPDYFKKG
ncbi:MAG: PTS sugar transporter subunit IIA, partial [Propionicimonas sp.]